MDAEPLTVHPDDLLSDVAEQVKDVHYGAAVASTTSGPVGLVTRAQLVRPEPRARAARRPRRAGAERARASSTPRSSRSSTTTTSARSRRACRCARRSTRSARPRRSSSSASARTAWSRAAESATVLLGAVLSDTVILNSPTTTDRDRAVVEYLERRLDVDAAGVRPRDVRGRLRRLRGDAPRRSSRATPRSTRSASGTIAIAQIETVGTALDDRRDELLEAPASSRASATATRSARSWSPTSSSGGTTLLVSGDTGAGPHARSAPTATTASSTCPA